MDVLPRIRIDHLEEQLNYTDRQPLWSYFICKLLKRTLIQRNLHHLSHCLLIYIYQKEGLRETIEPRNAKHDRRLPTRLMYVYGVICAEA